VLFGGRSAFTKSSHAWRLSAPLIVKISAGGDCRRAEISGESLEWTSFGFTEAVVCEALKEPIDRSGLYLIVRPIYQPLRGHCDGGKFVGGIALYGIRRKPAECGQVEHETARGGFITVRCAMFFRMRGERRALQQQIFDALLVIHANPPNDQLERPASSRSAPACC
jgi:hypothetical protein